MSGSGCRSREMVVCGRVYLMRFIAKLHLEVNALSVKHSLAVSSQDYVGSAWKPTR